jgi:Holliday junction resolvasome RuvABC DNA-binding subunit
VQAIANAEYEDLVKIPGIGDKTAKKIVECSRRPYT